MKDEAKNAGNSEEILPQKTQKTQKTQKDGPAGSQGALLMRLLRFLWLKFGSWSAPRRILSTCENFRIPGG
jgi:hypothetical protein